MRFSRVRSLAAAATLCALAQEFFTQVTPAQASAAHAAQASHAWLAEPSLAEPSLAEPSLAEPSLAEPSLAEPSLARLSVAAASPLGSPPMAAPPASAPPATAPPAREDANSNTVIERPGNAPPRTGERTGRRDSSRHRGAGARASARTVRVALGAATAEALVSGDGAWTLEDAWGRVHARARDGATWVVERRNRRLRARSSGGRSTAWSDEPFMLRPAGDAAAATWNGRAYRGTVAFVATDTAIVVINHVGVEDYLRGVVPIEIGAREPNEAAAVEAQAIAARSYVTVRMRESSDRAWDLTAAAIDQAYGGRAVEHTASDAAIAATKGLVLTFDGRVVRAPYHSTCGGRTAASDEIWQDAAAASARGAHARGANARGGSVPSYLRGVSDRIPGSDRAWCERSPRLHWSRTITGSALTDMVARYARLPGSDLAGGSVRGVRVERETATGRVAVLAIDTDGGTVRMRGNAIRFALREIGGEILNSTYFSLEPVTGRDGRLAQVTLRGTGNGHGVGMCQWGAIGRARAGQSAREILTAYYPGTVVDRLSDSFTEPRTAPR